MKCPALKTDSRAATFNAATQTKSNYQFSIVIDW